MNKFVFFRDDDVWKLDKNLKQLISIFLSYSVPLHLSVIPGKLTKDCKDFLMDLTKKYPNLIEFSQHGFKHINYSNSDNKFSKYEFGEKRSYEKQKSDILKGKSIMGSMNIDSKIFTPPWHGFNDDTLEILADANYSIISTDLKKPLPDNAHNLKNIPTSIYLNKKKENGWYIEKKEKIIKKINDISYDKIGIQIHHKAFNIDNKFNQLKNLLQELNEDKSINFIKLSEASEENISKKGIYLNSLIYYLTYQFVPKPLVLTKKSKNPIHKEYDFKINQKLKLFKGTELEISNQIYLRLKRVIKNKLPKNNKPIGLLLSGGLDSAAILHILRELTDRQIFTITGAYSKDEPHLKAVKKLSERYKTTHKNIIINPKDLLKIDEIYRKGIPQPIGDNGFLSTYIMMQSIKEKVEVIFTGDGADCLFCGLPSHYLNYIDHRYLKGMDTSKFRNNWGINKIEKNDCVNFEHYKYGEIFLEQKEIPNLLNKPFPIDLKAPIKLITDKIIINDFIKRQIVLDLNFLVKNRIDYTIYSAKNSKTEVKLPFLDKELVDFIIQIPSKYLIKNLKQKYILKKTFEEKLPKEIIDQNKKGFTPPFYLWYSKNKNFVIKKLIRGTNLGISKKYIAHLIKNINNSKNYQTGMKIWLILNLISWFENQKTRE